MTPAGGSSQEEVRNEGEDCCEEVDIRDLVVIDNPCFGGVDVEEDRNEVAKIPT